MIANVLMNVLMSVVAVKINGDLLFIMFWVWMALFIAGVWTMLGMAIRVDLYYEHKKPVVIAVSTLVISWLFGMGLFLVGWWIVRSFS